jgi:hypothetical protein
MSSESRVTDIHYGGIPSVALDANLKLRVIMIQPKTRRRTLSLAFTPPEGVSHRSKVHPPRGLNLPELPEQKAGEIDKSSWEICDHRPLLATSPFAAVRPNCKVSVALPAIQHCRVLPTVIDGGPRGNFLS